MQGRGRRARGRGGLTGLVKKSAQAGLRWGRRGKRRRPSGDKVWRVREGGAVGGSALPTGMGKGGRAAAAAVGGATAGQNGSRSSRANGGVGPCTVCTAGRGVIMARGARGRDGCSTGHGGEAAGDTRLPPQQAGASARRRGRTAAASAVGEVDWGRVCGGAVFLHCRDGSAVAGRVGSGPGGCRRRRGVVRWLCWSRQTAASARWRGCGSSGAEAKGRQASATSPQCAQGDCGGSGAGTGAGGRGNGSRGRGILALPRYPAPHDAAASAPLRRSPAARAEDCRCQTLRFLSLFLPAASPLPSPVKPSAHHKTWCVVCSLSVETRATIRDSLQQKQPLFACCMVWGAHQQTHQLHSRGHLVGSQAGRGGSEEPLKKPHST